MHLVNSANDNLPPGRREALTNEASLYRVIREPLRTRSSDCGVAGMQTYGWTDSLQNGLAIATKKNDQKRIILHRVSSRFWLTHCTVFFGTSLSPYFEPSGIPTKFTFIIDVLDMLSNCSSCFAEQLYYLLLSRPNSIVFTINHYMKLCLTIFRPKVS